MISTRLAARNRLGVVIALVLVSVAAWRADTTALGLGQIREGSGFGAAGTVTPFQQFVTDLRLDDKIQAPEVSQAFIIAGRETGPLAQELLVIRQRLLNVMLAERPGDVAGERSSYARAAKTMTAFEQQTFSRVFALLRDNQKSRAPRAWSTMAGIFHAPPPASARAERPKREDGGRGGRGPSTSALLHRMEILERSFNLSSDEKKTVKGILDAAFKGSGPVRDGLASARAVIVAAIQFGKAQADLEPLVTAYAEQASAMTALEMATLAKVLKALDRSQLENTAAIQTAFFLTRGMFLDKSKWDATPDYRAY